MILQKVILEHMVLIFKKKNHIRNYKACKKGAIAGLVTKFAIVALFGLALLSAVL